MTETGHLFRSFHRAVRFALPQRNAILAILALTLLMASANAAEPLALKLIFDGLTAERTLPPLLQGIGMLAVLSLVREAAHALSDWLTWRTTFIVAHRLSTVVNADRIIVLREGHIVESAPHAELLRKNGYYASLVRRQHHGLIPNDAAEATA
jgi:hypothetical protein